MAVPLAGETLNSDWMLADVHMKGYPFPDSEASVYWHNDGAFVIFPISPGRYRVLADLPMTSGAVPPTPTLEQARAIIAGGQGMNTGMQDAFNLAWKLALVIRNTCDNRLLDSYSPERSAVGDEVLKQASRLTAVGTLKNSRLQSIRNLVGHFMFGLSAVQHAFADSMGMQARVLTH